MTILILVSLNSNIEQIYVIAITFHLTKLVHYNITLKKYRQNVIINQTMQNVISFVGGKINYIELPFTLTVFRKLEYLNFINSILISLLVHQLQ